MLSPYTLRLVESFNKRVINEDFNRVVCTQLAEELDGADPVVNTPTARRP